MAIVVRGRRELPSLTGGASSAPAPAERLPGQALAVEKQARLRGAPAPAWKAIRAAEEARSLGGTRHPARAAPPALQWTSLQSCGAPPLTRSPPESPHFRCLPLGPDGWGSSARRRGAAP
eukprot:14444679-Alexandrium_andersonii.AAC.1